MQTGGDGGGYANARMLDGVIGVVQLHADRTHVLPSAQSQHRLDPVGSDDLRIVVQEDAILPLRSFDALVDDLREVEGTVEEHASHARILRDFFVIGKRFHLGAVVFDDDDLVRIVG